MYQRITFVALCMLAVIAVTGAAVRLTGSGLGCPEWPNSDTGHLTPHGTTGFHGTVEFVNRTFTGLVSVAVIVAVLGSFVRVPRRRDLTWLSAGLVAGVIGQVVLGGLTVIYGLSPPWVMAHFLVSMALVANAVVLHHRAGVDDPTAVAVTRRTRALGRALLVLCAVVLFTGTIVTGTGPHGGDEGVRRLGFSVSNVARVHGISVNVFLIAVLVVIWLLGREHAPIHTRRSASVLLAVLCSQATIGYVQYFSGVPEVLVAVHVLGAVSVWAATVHFVLNLVELRT
jgi:cytochrome c oxidase assembly protein subunit 15